MSRYFQIWASYKYADYLNSQVDDVSTWQPLLQLAGCINKIDVDFARSEGPRWRRHVISQGPRKNVYISRLYFSIDKDYGLSINQRQNGLLELHF